MALTLVERPPAGPTERLLILLPGYGDEPETLGRHLDVVDPRQVWHVAIARPPVATADGPAWFTVGADGPDPEETALSVTAIGDAAAGLLDRLDLTADAAVLAGFSQGGAMALAAALDPTLRHRPGAVAALAAYLPHRELDQDPGLVAGRPVLVAHGADDDVVDPILGRGAAKALERAGASVSWVEVDGDHHLGPALLGALARWLDELTRS